MKRGVFVLVAILLVAGLAFSRGAAERQTETRVVYMTAGDMNMLALGQNVLGPLLAEENPELNLMTIHTGPGNEGSRRIFEKLMAEKQAGKEAWDVDVAMVHEIFMTWAMEEDLLMPYAKELSTWQYVTSPFAHRALGVEITGYAMPMFHSQTALAYNPDYVDNPPQTFEELEEWVRENPGRFGHNGIQGGMSGVAFANAWVAYKTGNWELYSSGPFDQSEVDQWEAVFKDLAEFNKYVTITSGNVGTLDALNRGEIWMGPVWVDMFFTFMNDGKLDRNTRLTLPSPGMPGQPMYFVIPRNAANAEGAKRFVELVTRPDTQANEIIKRFNWYPGIDGSFVEDMVPPETFEEIYGDVTPVDLQQKGLAFPIADYFTAIIESYERWVD